VTVSVIWQLKFVRICSFSVLQAKNAFDAGGQYPAAVCCGALPGEI